MHLQLACTEDHLAEFQINLVQFYYKFRSSAWLIVADYQLRIQSQRHIVAEGCHEKPLLFLQRLLTMRLDITLSIDTVGAGSTTKHQCSPKDSGKVASGDERLAKLRLEVSCKVVIHGELHAERKTVAGHQDPGAIVSAPNVPTTQRYMHTHVDSHGK